MTTFVISDVHGHFSVLKQALKKAGFDEQNVNHHLLSLGDMFDRGKENKEVFEYLYSLHKEGKATLLLGNHDLFLLEFLKGDFESAEFNAAYNGFDETLKSFSGIKYRPKNLEKIYQTIQKNYPHLETWLDSLPLYLEKSPYIFTHGGIDGSKENWHDIDRKSFVWQYQSRLPGIDGKTIVVGHERTAMIRLNRGEISELNPFDLAQFLIIKERGKIFIDGFVEFSKHINVLKLEIDIKA